MNTSITKNVVSASRDGEMQLSIIIVSYNTLDITRACLKSLESASLTLKHEILVDDNASQDGSPDMIEREFPAVILVRNARNRMFAGANNQAMAMAGGRYILLLNSDTLVAPGNIEKMVEFIDQRRPRVGCVGPRVVRADGTIQSEGEPFSSIGYVLSRFFCLHKVPLPFFVRKRILPVGFPFGMEGRTRRVGWVVGCSIMFPKDLIRQCGGLDEDFVFYCEEMEFCYRLQRYGYETWVVPDAQITHLGSASFVAAKTLERRDCPDIPSYFERRLLFYQKTSGVSRQIATNRVQITLYSCILPLLKLGGRKEAVAVKEKIEFHREENRIFLKKLTGGSAPRRSDAK